MKKLLNLLLITAVSTLAFTSCKDSNTNFQDDTEAYLKAEKALDSLFAAQALKIEEFVKVDGNFTNPVQDTVTVSFQYLGKKIKRGLWYQVLETPTDNAYEYKGQLVNSYYGYYFAPILPKVKLKYTAKLLDGTIVQKDLEGSTYDLATTSNTIFNSAWQISFVPYIIKHNGENKVVNGLTAQGLKKGSKIKVITPSYWAFGDKKVGEIPANSPLVYEFEVLEIQ